MCIASLFGSPSANTAVTAPPPVASPTRASEENQSSVGQSLEELRRRKGIESTYITGGLGDAGYGSSVTRPTVTALGKAA